MKKPLLLAIFLTAFSSLSNAQNSNTSISINIDGDETTVEIEETVNGKTTATHLQGEEAQAWIQSHGNNYSFSSGHGCSSFHFNDTEKEDFKREMRQAGMELEDGLDELSKSIDDLEIEKLVDEIQRSVESLQKEIEIKIRNSSDDDSAVI